MHCIYIFFVCLFDFALFCLIPKMCILCDKVYVIIFSAPIIAPSGPPQNITAQASSATNVYITWNRPAADDRNGIIINYIVNVTGVETGEQMQLFSVSESVNITGLTPYTTYLCIVAASTAIGPGPFSTVTTVRTPRAGIEDYR